MVRAWLPAATVAAVQALVLVLAVPLLGVGARNPVGAALFALAAAAVFAAVNLGLVALWGRAGMVVSLAFLALQVACVGVLIPLQTAPPVFGKAQERNFARCTILSCRKIKRLLGLL